MDIKKQKEELHGLIALYGLFTVVLALVDMFYSAWGEMPVILGALAIIANIAVVSSFVLVLKEWEDPKFDFLRKLYFVFFVIAIGLVAGYRIAKNEGKMFQQDVDKAKQESARLNEFGEKTNDDSILAIEPPICVEDTLGRIDTALSREIGNLLRSQRTRKYKG